MRIAILTILFLFFPLISQAASLGSKLSGKILLNVEGNGEAWYVNPADYKRYYLGRPSDAFEIMRELAIGITNDNLDKIASADILSPTVAGVSESNDVEGSEKELTASSTAETENIDEKLSENLAGYILLQVEDNGEAWYVNPDNLKRYYLGRPEDAFEIMRELSLGISREDLARVHKPGFDESINEYSSYEHKTITIDDEDFTADIVTIDLDNPNLEIITDTAQNENCEANCTAENLAYFAVKNNAFAGINGTYFDTGSNLNYYFAPVYNTEYSKLINEDELKYWTTGPIMVFDENNKFYYFKDSREFESVKSFESNYGVKIQAAIGNKPRLIEEGMNLLIDWDLDDKQKYTKAQRNAIAYKDNKLYLVIIQNATLIDLANVMKEMEVEYALNLDGGYSSALFYNDEYMIGPGRDIPNVILFRER